MNRISAVEPAADLSALVLPGAPFADAYRVILDGPAPDAETAARIMFRDLPGWVNGLMGLRDAVVAPLGLKTGDHPALPGQIKIGIFPVQSVTPSRIVLGFDDKHLDFRVVVDTAWAAGGGEVTVATLVRFNNGLGRAYLTAILPFHRMIARTMLKNLIRSDTAYGSPPAQALS